MICDGQALKIGDFRFSFQINIKYVDALPPVGADAFSYYYPLSHVIAYADAG